MRVQMVKKKNMTQEKKFLFVVIVKMRERGFLDLHNEPTPHTRQNSKCKCPLPAFGSGVNIRPKFAQTMEGAAAVTTVQVWTDEDYTSKLNLLCQQRFGSAFTLASEALPYQGGFVATVIITPTSLDTALTHTASTAYRTKKDAKQCAAKLAFQALTAMASAPSSPQSQDTVVDASSSNQPASPAATSFGSMSPTSRQEPGTHPPPGQDFKSLLNLFCQKKGGGWSVKYETTEKPRGVFASVAVIAVVNERFTGQPCKNKKEAEQAAARTAWYAQDTLSDREWEIVP
eukprot:869647-Rhodomonas_salina.1